MDEIISSDKLFLLVPFGNGYYQPRYPDEGRHPVIEENPGMSLVEKDYLMTEAINKLRSLSSITKSNGEK